MGLRDVVTPAFETEDESSALAQQVQQRSEQHQQSVQHNAHSAGSKKMSKPSVVGNKVTTGIVRLVYPNLENPRPEDAEIDKNKYTVMVLIPKEDVATYEAMQEAINVAAIAKFKKARPDLAYPIKDGDKKADKEGDPVPWYQGHWFLNLKSNNKPTILDPFKNKVTDASFIKGGDWGRVRIAFSGYDQSGNRGVGSYVDVVQFARSGDPLGGGENLDDFDTIEEEFV